MRLAFGFLLVFSGITVFGQESALTVFPDEEVAEVILRTDLRTLVRNKFREEYQESELWIFTDGDTLRHQVEIRSRGNMRKEVCLYPPVRIKFEKGAYLHRKLKWVNVCRDTDVNEGLLLKEYLLYKLLRIITDKALDARLVHVLYIDTNGREEPFSRYAFVLQDEDEVAEYFGGRVYASDRPNLDYMNAEQLAIVLFFQYMIGNTDWALENQHNLLLITQPETNTILPVPYDFDYSGFVDASYAIPHPTLPITHVTMRHNKGPCIDEEVCEKVRQLYLSREEDILTYVGNFEVLDNKMRKNSTAYLQDFFKLMDDEKTVQRIFTKNCAND